MARSNQQQTMFADDDKAPTKAQVAQPAVSKGAVAKATPKGKAKTDSKAVAVHQPQRQPASLLEVCMWAAQQKDMEPERLRAYLEMARDQERAEAEILFDEAMLAAQAEMPRIPRSSYNSHTKSWWAKIEAVADKVDPVIRRHGFTIKYGMADPRMEDHYHVFADVTWIGKLASGKKVSFTKRYDIDMGRDDIGAKGGGTKTGAQGSGSVITYARRYLKLMAFDVLVLGVDRDGNPVGREPISAKETKKLKADLATANFKEEGVLAYYQIDKLENLDRGQLEDINARIASKLGNAA